jgi:hypothetical protein
MRRDTSDPETCQWVRNQLPARAIRALEDIEAIRVDEHLLICAACEAERAAWDASIPVLALAAPQSSPSPDLRQRILAQAGAPTEIKTPAAPAWPVSSPVDVAQPVGAPPRRWPAIRMTFAVVPALALITILSLLTVSSQQQLSREQDRAYRLEQENAVITANLLVLQSGASGANGNARWYPMLSVDEMFAEAGGAVLGDPSQSTALLSVWNMPESIGPFQVICESQFGELLAAGELQVNDLGVGTVTLNLPGPMTEYRVVHIVHASDLASGSDPRTNDVLLVRLDHQTGDPPVE